MKNSNNKISTIYIISSMLLFAGLLFGGVYGVYVSVGLSFVRTSAANVVGNDTGVNNVSFGGTVDFQPSMTGVIILSIILILLAIFDFINLIKQIIFFKQFKFIRTSKFEKNMERRVKSKGSVIFYAIAIDVLSFIVGVVGIFINSRTLVPKNIVWILYIIDALVAVLSVISVVMLLKKLKMTKETKSENILSAEEDNNEDEILENDYDLNVDYLSKVENQLIKLKYLKASKMISSEEYELLRKRIIGSDVKREE